LLPIDTSLVRDNQMVLGVDGDLDIATDDAGALAAGLVEDRDIPGEQVEPAAQHDELRASRADHRPVVAAEIGDRLEVRHQAAGQSHQLDATLALQFKPLARLDTIAIAVEIDLQQRRGMIGWPSRRFRYDGKAQSFQVKLINENVDDADRIVPSHRLPGGGGAVSLAADLRPQ